MKTKITKHNKICKIKKIMSNIIIMKMNLKINQL